MRNNLEFRKFVLVVVEFQILELTSGCLNGPQSMEKLDGSGAVSDGIVLIDVLINVTSSKIVAGKVLRKNPRHAKILDEEKYVCRRHFCRACTHCLVIHHVDDCGHNLVVVAIFYPRKCSLGFETACCQKFAEMHISKFLTPRTPEY